MSHSCFSHSCPPASLSLRCRCVCWMPRCHHQLPSDSNTGIHDWRAWFTGTVSLFSIQYSVCRHMTGRENRRSSLAAIQRQVWLSRKWFDIVRYSICVLQAEKAEGFIDLTNFMIDRAIECKKKQWVQFLVHLRSDRFDQKPVIRVKMDLYLLCNLNDMEWFTTHSNVRYIV